MAAREMRSLTAAIAAVGRDSGTVSRWLKPLAVAMGRYEITGSKRVPHFLGQIAHESAGLTVIEENLRYSAAALRRVWPHRFPEDLAKASAFHPEAIANRAYGGRMGNGPEETGDGWRYRGRGLIQLTGRDNYRRCGVALDLPLEDRPDLLLQDDKAALAAAWFWSGIDGNALADDDRITLITKRINGGLNGIVDRKRLWSLARAAYEAAEVQARLRQKIGLAKGD
jgi:putative chitinase